MQTIPSPPHMPAITAGPALARLDVAAAASTLEGHDGPSGTPTTQPPVVVYQRPHQEEVFCAFAPTQAGVGCCMLIAATTRHVLVMDARAPHQPQLVWQHALGKGSPQGVPHLQLQARWTTGAAPVEQHASCASPSQPAAGAPRGRPRTAHAQASSSQAASQGLPGPAWQTPQPAPGRPVPQLTVYLSDGLEGAVVAMHAWSQPAAHRLAAGDSERWLRVLPLERQPGGPQWSWRPRCMTRWCAATAGVAAALPLRSLVDHAAGSRGALGPAALRWCLSTALDNQVCGEGVHVSGMGGTTPGLCITWIAACLQHSQNPFV